MQEVTGMALGSISNLIKKYNRFGYVKNHPKSEAKHETTPRIDRQIIKMVQDNQFGIQVSPFTIQNQLGVDLKQEFHARNHSFQKPIKSEDSHLLRNM